MHLKVFTNSIPWITSLFLLPVFGLILFVLQTHVRGLQRSDRVKQAGGSIFLNQWIMEYAYWVLNTPAKFLVRWRVSPNTVTLSGFAVVIAGVVATALGYFGLGGPLILVGSLSDMLDGIVARERGLCSNAGEFVDAMVDRYADIALYMGLCIYYMQRPWCILLVLLALLGSVMVSYARAKAESLGVLDAPGGSMRRAERAVYLGFSILLSPLVATLTESQNDRPMYYLVLAVCILIGVLANISALQMTLHVLQTLNRGTSH